MSGMRGDVEEQPARRSAGGRMSAADFGMNKVTHIIAQ